MCTALSFKNNYGYFGRNMDIGYSFNEEVVFVPRNYDMKFKHYKNLKNHFAMIGVACVINDYPLFADAINEHGLGIAGLNFPDYAHYNENICDDKSNIAPYEIIPWILSTCKNVEQARELLSQINIISLPFLENLQLAPLHWIISDKENSIVLESTKDGVKIFDNPVGVLTNNPTFDWHLTNLSNYLGCCAVDLCEKDILGHTAKPLGHGTGGIGLPGDTSTTSRFIKTVFAKQNSKCEPEETSNISQFFHILDSVAVPRGFAVSKDGIADYTTYSVCASLDRGIYYYKTYDNNQITAINMHSENLDSSKLQQYKMITTQQIKYAN